MHFINTGTISKTVTSAMTGLVNRIIAEEANAAADRVKQRIVEEGMRLRADISAMARADSNRTEVIIAIHEAPEKT